MNINQGYQIDEPNVLIPWDIDEHTLVKVFDGYDIKHVTIGYYTISCKSLNGLECMIGFHFEPRKNGQLNELEFFRTDYNDPEKSFTEFQSYFEKEFGKPSSENMGNERFKNYAWNLEGAQIVHFVFDRFGPEEHMRIKRIKKHDSTTMPIPNKGVVAKLKSWFS